MRTPALRLAVLLGVALWPPPMFPHEAVDEQLARLSARIARQPDDSSLYLRRGDQYRYRGDWSRARADYVQARRIDPALDAVSLRLGALQLDQGHPRRAKAALDRYLARQPNDVGGLRMRSTAHRRLGMPLAAAEDLRRVIAAFTPPRQPEPDDFLERARALEAAGPCCVEAAILALDDGIAALGPIVSLQFPAIDLDLRVGRFDDALRRIDVLEAASGRRDVWLVKRAEILDRRSRETREP